MSIKPCPFCGNIPETFTESHNGVPKHIRGWSQIRCVNKECKIVVYVHKPMSLPELIDIWNERK
jgi:hypothetical protein